ncbi:MAG: class I SAM-dependent methyltransferase [Nitrosomonas sp.]|nr:class I SAM-dependent methyltransferase [Nitrosomonas sp.]MDP1951386.1 class I SAM-dependent methyltransferase [Nitrosomonas sp.]
MNEVFHSGAEMSITSLAALVPGKTVVSVCAHCGHLETSSLFDLDQYYDTGYKIGGINAEEDDLYAIESGRMVFRSEHMASVLLQKTSNLGITTLLDYGCGKSLTSQRAMADNPDLDIYLFDVSRDYEAFWKSFRPDEKLSFFNTPLSWNGSFNCVTSFFSLEHVPFPRDSVARIRSLLRNGGYLYAIVPNIYSVNRADLLVVDHLHHYSLSSMKYCLSSCGFELIEVDNLSHQQASIYIAKAVAGQPSRIEPDPAEVQESIQDAYKLADFWQGVEARLLEFEVRATTSGVGRIFIYGAGIVGIFLYSRFRNKQIIAGFIDSNLHKQKKRYCGLPVVSPSAVQLAPSDGLLVGLNAGVGEPVIASMRQFEQIAKNIFFC